jgi:hypothetical protein
LIHNKQQRDGTRLHDTENVSNGRRDEKTNTGEGGKGKRTRTVSDDVGRKSVSEKSESTGGQCVSENSTGGKSSGDIRNNTNIFETSRRDNPQYFVDVLKDKRTKNNNLEFLIG